MAQTQFGSPFIGATRRPSARKHQAPLKLVMAAVMGAVLFAQIPASVSATTPGQNGLIGFRRFSTDGNTAALFVMNPDGSHQTQITFPADGVVDQLGAWSPDGTQLAFSRSTPCGDECGRDDLYVVNANGSDLHHLVTPETTVEAPAWSPDGQWIAFPYSTGEEGSISHSIWEIRVDGSDLHQVTDPTPNLAEDTGVQFSPDGTKLVIERDLASCGWCAAIFTVDATDGGNPIRVSPRGLNGFDHPDWSPDGKWVVFRTQSGRGGASAVYVAHPGGTHLQMILDGIRNGRGFKSSTFSPDGLDLIIAITPGLGPDGNPDLWVGRFDATEHLDSLVAVTRTDVWESSPRWGTAPVIR